MNSRVSRLLLAASAAICAFGSVMHAVAYVAKARASIVSSNLSPLLAAEFKALWLADSTTLMTLAVIFGFIAVKPAPANKMLTLLLAIVPAAIAALLYAYLGAFYAGHMLLAASAMVIVAGAIMPGPQWRS